MSERARIVIVDDQALYREGLIELFRRWDEFSIVGDADSGEGAIELCAQHRPDLVLLDVKMPNVDGIEACGVIRGRFPDTAVVMLSLYGEKERVLGAIANGADGYLLKSIHAKQLRSKLRSVLGGGGALSDEASSICIEALRRLSFGIVDQKETNRLASLMTVHEREILRFVAVGASNKEIADSLHISESTVKKQLSQLMMKLGLANRVQAAVFALRSGLAQ